MKKYFKHIFILSFTLIIILSAYTTYGAKALVNFDGGDDTSTNGDDGLNSPIYDPGGNWDVNGGGVSAGKDGQSSWTTPCDPGYVLTVNGCTKVNTGTSTGGIGISTGNNNTGGFGGNTTGGGAFNCRSLTGANGKVVFADIISFATCTISSIIIPLLVALAIMVFIYGVITYVISADDEEKRKTGRQYMMYGIIGIFVMVSVWGLVNILSNTFGVANVIPQIQTQ